MNTGKTLLGIAAGIATGVLLGELFAPNKGSETRRKIGKKSKNIKEEFARKYNDMINNIAKKINDLELNTETMFQKSKEAINKI